jgi:hypothetical protein
MSAFIVEKKTIDRIVSYIHENGTIHHTQSYYPAIYDVYKGDPNKLGQVLWVMNIGAVNQRYKEKNPISLYYYEYYPTNIIQTYKSLQCYLYQCAEGNVLKTSLYKDLDKLSCDIADKIISDLPEYKNAEWA